MAGTTNPKLLNPLNQNMIAGARAGVETANELLAYFAACTDCGMQVHEYIAQTTALRDYLQSVVDKFGGSAQS